MLTFSPFEAHPHILIFASRCNIMLSLIICGSFTWAVTGLEIINHIEVTVESCAPEVRPGHVTAFGYDDGRRKDLVLVAELNTVEATEPAALSVLARRIRTAVALTHEVMPGAVILVEPGRIPKTTSGKLRRGECGPTLRRRPLWSHWP